MYDLVLKNCNVINENVESQVDIAIKNQRIEKIAASIHSESSVELDLSGKPVIPGLIDDQVHFREPGLTHKGEIATESKAALAGGVTSYFEMPNVNPNTSTIENLEKKFEMASTKSVGNYSFYLGATNDNIEEIKKHNPKTSCGLKVFMGASTGDLLVDRDSDIEKIFKYSNKIIAIHSEDEQVLNETVKTIKNPNFSDHPKMRPVKAAVTSTNKAINFALKYKKRLHVLHLSTSEEVKIIRKIKNTGLVTSETTPQHLLLNAPNIYDDIGSYAQMNPPIREKHHQEELWKGLFDGTINCIATDHAPHTIQEKNKPYGSAPSGMPGVETSLPLMLNQVNKGKITLQDIIKWMCENPAKIYQIKKN